MGKVYDALKKWQSQNAAPEPVPAAERLQEPGRAEEPRRTRAAEPPVRLVPRLDGVDPHLIIHPGAASILIEQYKILRTRLFQARAQRPRSLLITSVAPREGKSTLAANLAVAIAQAAEDEVLLVDADLRAPSVGRLFGVPPRAGLEGYLQGEASLEEALQRSGVARLSLLPCAKPVPKVAAELLASTRMKEFLGAVHSRFGLVIFDSTPLSVTADAAIIANEVDAILVVVRAGLVNRELISQSLDRIDKAKIVGSVLTCQPFKSFDSRYKYHYKYYHPSKE